MSQWLPSTWWYSSVSPTPPGWAEGVEAGLIIGWRESRSLLLTMNRGARVCFASVQT